MPPGDHTCRHRDYDFALQHATPQRRFALLLLLTLNRTQVCDAEGLALILALLLQKTTGCPRPALPYRPRAPSLPHTLDGNVNPNPWTCTCDAVAAIKARGYKLMCYFEAVGLGGEGKPLQPALAVK